MSDCPNIDELLTTEANGREAAAHVEGCAACSALVALATFRGIAARVSEAPEVCATFEPSIAALVDGTLGAARLAELIDHLGRCGACNDLAARLSLFRGELDDVPEPEVQTWGKEKVMQAIDIDATNPSSVSVEATPVNETTEVQPRPVVVLDGPARWRQRAHWTAAVAAGVAIGLIGGGALFLRRGETASAPPPEPASNANASASAKDDGTAARPGGAYVGDVETRLAELERRAQAAEERAKQAELRSRFAEARVNELESHLGPVAPAPSGSGHVYGPFPRFNGPVPDHAGYLTIVCNPSCEEILDNNEPLGPSPIVHRPLVPGRHALLLRHEKVIKTLVVTLKEGDLIAERMDMR